MNKKKFYGKGLPNLNPSQLKGSFIVIEGGDGAGRTTQIFLLKDYLEGKGLATMVIGLKRSELVGAELREAMEGNTLCPLTLSLFYATDLADQLEKVVIPALKAGFVVIADRYIYTLMARDIVRGGDPAWLKDVYGFAPVPDLVIYLKASAQFLAERSLQKKGTLDYWESGMDIQRSGDTYQCFVSYQRRLNAEYMRMVKDFGLRTVDANSSPLDVATAIHAIIDETIKLLRRPVLHPTLGAAPRF